jgi:hypothetical protein
VAQVINLQDVCLLPFHYQKRTSELFLHFYDHNKLFLVFATDEKVWPWLVFLFMESDSNLTGSHGVQDGPGDGITWELGQWYQWFHYLGTFNSQRYRTKILSFGEPPSHKDCCGPSEAKFLPLELLPSDLRLQFFYFHKISFFPSF